MSMQEARNPSAERARLNPATVGERWIVGCWGGEMPVLVRSIKTRAMPSGVRSVSVCKAQRDRR